MKGSVAVMKKLIKFNPAGITTSRNKVRIRMTSRELSNDTLGATKEGIVVKWTREQGGFPNQTSRCCGVET
jgi:hypothetical protein